MRKRSQRVSSEAMAVLAHEHPGSEIEIDADTGHMYLSILNVEYVATMGEQAAS